MNVLKDGHKYELDILDGDGDTQLEKLDFVNRGHGEDEAGTNNQEVLRVLIDRVQFMEDEKHWHGNKNIIHHLRMALVLHESRHLERLTERDILRPEKVQTSSINGHFKIKAI